MLRTIPTSRLVKKCSSFEMSLSTVALPKIFIPLAFYHFSNWTSSAFKSLM